MTLDSSSCQESRHDPFSEIPRSAVPGLNLNSQIQNRQQGIQSAGILGGVGVPGSAFSDAGSAGLDLSQLLLLSQLFEGQGGEETTTQ